MSIASPTTRLRQRLSHGDLLKLKRWNSCTIANALEQITRADPLTLVNLEEVRDFMPEMGPMVGTAVTVVISGGDPKPKREHRHNFARYREYLGSVAGPKIVVVQDADKPRCYGSIWGEVGANVARAFGCVGTITDGAIRDLDEMKNAGFKALARRLAVSHAHCWPLRWDCDVDAFGTRIKPGQLIHADKHGFIIIPRDAHARLLEAARFLDDRECETVIAAGRQQTGRPTLEVSRAIQRAAATFGAAIEARFGGTGEWGRPAKKIQARVEQSS